MSSWLCSSIAGKATPSQEELDQIVADLIALITEKKCGPILIRLSWHDAASHSTGKGGCPNAAMKFAEEGEALFEANRGLPTVAVGLLKEIGHKYVPHAISTADLWALAATVAIKLMGGPAVPTRFGRVDAKSSAEGVKSQEGRWPDGDKGADHLRQVFYAKGFNDQEIVALSGAHTVGSCHAERSGFDGKWTRNPLGFDNAYFKDMLRKKWKATTIASTGKPQFSHWWSGTMMMISDLALLEDPEFKTHVERYAADQDAFFADFAAAFQKLQELGYSNLTEMSATVAPKSTEKPGVLGVATAATLSTCVVL